MAAGGVFVVLLVDILFVSWGGGGKGILCIFGIGRGGGVQLLLWPPTPGPPLS